MQTIQRLWLLNWSLFAFTNKEGDSKGLIELFLKNKNIKIIKTIGQYLLRYLTYMIVIYKDNQIGLKDFTLILQTKYYNFDIIRDPFSKFIVNLNMNFNTDLAFSTLKECERVIVNDVILNNYKDK